MLGPGYPVRRHRFAAREPRSQLRAARARRRRTRFVSGMTRLDTELTGTRAARSCATVRCRRRRCAKSTMPTRCSCSAKTCSRRRRASRSRCARPRAGCARTCAARQACPEWQAKSAARHRAARRAIRSSSRRRRRRASTTSRRRACACGPMRSQHLGVRGRARTRCRGAGAARDVDGDTRGRGEADRRGAARRANGRSIVSGTGLGSAAVIEAAANVAWALQKTGHPGARLSLAVPEANSLGMALFDAPPLEDALDARRRPGIGDGRARKRPRTPRAESVLTPLLARAHLVVLDHQMTPTARARRSRAAGGDVRRGRRHADQHGRPRAALLPELRSGVLRPFDRNTGVVALARPCARRRRREPRTSTRCSPRAKRNCRSSTVSSKRRRMRRFACAA